MNKKKLASIIHSSCCLAIIGAVGVPEAHAEEADLGDLVVTATRTERQIADVPASVSLITAEDIERSTAQSADELLQEVAGVDVLHSIGVLSVSSTNDVGMRGMTGAGGRTLLLIDGVPANTTYDGNPEWNQVATEDIARIEVVRGATSALYGSNAMGGVINIITKKPSEETRTTISLGYGSMNTKDGSASLSGSSGRFGYRLSGSVLRSDGYNPVKADKRKDTSIDKGAERNNFRGSMSYDLTDASSLSLTGDYYDHKTTGTYDVPDYNAFNDTKKTVTARYSSHLDEGREFGASLYNKNEDSGYDITYGTTINSTSSNKQITTGGDAQYTVPFYATGFGDHIVTTGIDFRQGRIDRKDDYTSGQLKITKGSQRYAGLFLQDELFLNNDNLVLNVGGRYDYWKNYDGYYYQRESSGSSSETNHKTATQKAFNPKVGALYHLTPATAIRGSVGKAFRSPSLSDLYRLYIYNTTIKTPDPDLGPETVMSYEIGVDQQLGNSGTLSVTAYRNNADDFIGMISTPCIDPAFDRCLTKTNIGEVSTQGVETEFRYRITERWGLVANYTYNRSVVEKYSPDPTLEGNFLPDAPEHKGNISATFTDPSLFNAKATARYIGNRYNDDVNAQEWDSYTLVDLHLSKDINKHYRVSLGINDLFDKGFTEYYITPGRTVTGKLTARF